MAMTIQLSGTVPDTYTNKRLDQALAFLFPNYSRAQLQTWIKAGFVQVDGKIQNKIRTKIFSHQHITIVAKPVTEIKWLPEAMPLDIIYEDKELLVINKPAGLIVHPGAGVSSHTLVNALLHHDKKLAQIPRAGIVHRLDKDTSGLLVIARTLATHHFLISQMQQRKIHREYIGIVKGVVISGGTVNATIGRHRNIRTKMAVTQQGRQSVTHYRVLERFRAHTALQFILETGRTHQIRVHMDHIHFPLVGDPVYGKHINTSEKLSPTLKTALQKFQRQALHARKLALEHPSDARLMEWQAPLPHDMQDLLDSLRKDLVVSKETK